VVASVVGVLAALVAGCTGEAPVSGPQGASRVTSGPSAPSTSVSLAVVPPDNAANVVPADPVTITAVRGTLAEVALTNEAGKQVAGELASDGLGWTSVEPLGYARAYTLTVTASGVDGKRATSRSTFTTVNPDKQVNLFMRPGDGETVGVGHPLVFSFDTAVDKALVEKSIAITTDPKVDGAFYWFSDKEVHWRPQELWKVGSKVAVNAAVYGKRLGDGIYGKEDRRAAFTVGDAMMAEANGASHQMTVRVNGRVVRTMPISLGMPAFPSNNGIHVVSEKNENMIMDSTTYGLPFEAGGYRVPVQFATRISNGGEFVHAAPWSLNDQGHRNVSHGCINMSTENASWFFGFAKMGDIVVVTNSGGPNLEPWDGLGDWNLPWADWLKGGPR
jgi:lipoprotein-anchoring transpeptidase ErfK/SrfK